MLLKISKNMTRKHEKAGERHDCLKKNIQKFSEDHDLFTDENGKSRWPPKLHLNRVLKKIEIEYSRKLL